MKTQKQAFEAYVALIQLGKGVKGLTAYALYKLKNELKKIVDFQSEEEMKLIEKHGGTVTETNMIQLPDDADKKAFNKEMEELHNLGCDVQPIEVKVSELPDITLLQVETLDGFIKFIEE